MYRSFTKNVRSFVCFLQTSSFTSGRYPEFWDNPEEFDPYRFGDEEINKRWVLREKEVDICRNGKKIDKNLESKRVWRFSVDDYAQVFCQNLGTNKIS